MTLFDRLEEKKDNRRLDVVLLVLSEEEGLPLRYISPNVVELTGYTADEFLADGKLWIRNVHPEDRNLVKVNWQRLESHGAVSYQYRFAHKDGHYVHIQDDLRVVSSPVDGGTEIVGSAVGIAFGAVRSHVSALEEILDNAVSSALYVADTMGYVEWTNVSFERLFGYSAKGGHKSRLHLLKLDRSDDATAIEQWRHLLTGRSWIGKAAKLARDGTELEVSETIYPIVDENGVPFRFLGILEPTGGGGRTEETSSASASSEFDPTTGFYTLTGFQKAGTAYLRGAGEADTVCVCTAVALTNFDDVASVARNEVLEELIFLIADRIRQEASFGELCCYRGAGRFTILGTALSSGRQLAPSLLERFREPFLVEGQEYRLDLSIGLAAARADKVHLNDLLFRARVALHKAQQDPERRIAEYDGSDEQASRRRLLLLQSLRRAVAEQQLFLEYQPIVDLASKRIVGAEALVRWDHPELGRVPPDEFIALAEETGDIVEIGAAIFEIACRQLADWRAKWGFGGTLAVNISGVQLRHEDFVDFAVATVGQAGLRPRDIEIEVTESILIREDSGALDALSALHEKGFELALDDFGKGYSNLSYLNILPIGKLKVDRFFIEHARTDAKCEKILRALVALASELECTLLGEGVEAPESLEYLRLMGFDQAQGFVLGRPMSAEQLMLEIGRSGSLSAPFRNPQGKR